MKKSSNPQFLKFIVYIVVLMLTSSPIRLYAQSWSSTSPVNDKDNYKGMGVSKESFNHLLKTFGFRESKYTSQSVVSSSFVPFNDVACYYLTYKEKPSPVYQAAYYYYVGETDKCIELAHEIEKSNLLDYYKAKVYGYALACINNDLNHYKLDRTEIDDSFAYWSDFVTNVLSRYLISLKEKSAFNFDYVESVKAQEFLDEINMVRTACSLLMNICGGTDVEKKYAKLDKDMLQYSHDVFSPRINLWMRSSTLRVGIYCNELAWQEVNDKIGKTDSFTLDGFWEHVKDTTENAIHDDYYLKQLSNIEKLCYVKTTTKLLANRCIQKGGGKYWCETLNFMLRARNYELFVNGDKRCTNFAHVTWQSIAEMLDENECALEHFEAGVPKDEPFVVEDATMRTRNYAFVISKQLEVPVMITRGYRDAMDSRGISIIDEMYTGIEKVYMTSTPMMVLSDVAGTEERIVLLHSLTDISKAKNRQVPNLKDILFIGDIAYSKNGGNGIAKERIISNKYQIGQLEGAKTEAEAIKKRFPQAKLLTGLDATPENVKAEMQKAKIIHISTHGIFDENIVKDINEKYPHASIIGQNVLVACQLALSGYNDNKILCINASEIEQLDLSNVDLVFLDACESAAGQEIANRVYSMAESLHNAGVKCVIANLDPIPDNLATEFALSFYTCLEGGMSYHDSFYGTKQVFGYLAAPSTMNDPQERENFAKEASSLRIILWE